MENNTPLQIRIELGTNYLIILDFDHNNEKKLKSIKISIGTLSSVRHNLDIYRFKPFSSVIHIRI